MLQDLITGQVIVIQLKSPSYKIKKQTESGALHTTNHLFLVNYKLVNEHKSGEHMKHKT